MAETRVPWHRRVANWWKELTSKYDTVETTVTEQTDGKETFYYQRTIGRCTRCGCGLEVEVENKIMTEEEYLACKASTLPGRVME